MLGDWKMTPCHSHKNIYLHPTPVRPYLGVNCEPCLGVKCSECNQYDEGEQLILCFCNINSHIGEEIQNIHRAAPYITVLCSPPMVALSPLSALSQIFSDNL